MFHWDPGRRERKTRRSCLVNLSTLRPSHLIHRFRCGTRTTPAEKVFIDWNHAQGNMVEIQGKYFTSVIRASPSCLRVLNFLHRCFKVWTAPWPWVDALDRHRVGLGSVWTSLLLFLSQSHRGQRPVSPCSLLIPSQLLLSHACSKDSVVLSLPLSHLLFHLVLAPILSRSSSFHLSSWNLSFSFPLGLSSLHCLHFAFVSPSVSIFCPLSPLRPLCMFLHVNLCSSLFLPRPLPPPASSLLTGHLTPPLYPAVSLPCSLLSLPTLRGHSYLFFFLNFILLLAILPSSILLEVWREWASIPFSNTPRFCASLIRLVSIDKGEDTFSIVWKTEGMGESINCGRVIFSLIKRKGGFPGGQWLRTPCNARDISSILSLKDPTGGGAIKPGHLKYWASLRYLMKPVPL